ncbi:hypothetical protein BLNAU_17193 [Blattamonas nauphoetae]|uniref:Uncharacterized protein n=1 Tax=Blattamonas nauphoetae TaxID=2049346 RepID=A0ABQ9X9E4_9EUKA|nr:hypothetical protein BLNAU_17193 [Blattamonas nauphoetae]
MLIARHNTSYWIDVTRDMIATEAPVFSCNLMALSIIVFSARYSAVARIHSPDHLNDSNSTTSVNRIAIVFPVTNQDSIPCSTRTSDEYSIYLYDYNFGFNWDMSRVIRRRIFPFFAFVNDYNFGFNWE